MNIQQAMAEAKKRWGLSGLAWLRVSGGKVKEHAVGFIDSKNRRSPNIVCGTGDNFEKAFANATKEKKTEDEQAHR
jgi:hypothetical protein